MTRDGGSKSGIKFHVLCAACGHPSPTSLHHCPACGGALLGKRTPPDVHALQTMILPGRRPTPPPLPELTAIDTTILPVSADSRSGKIANFDQSDLFDYTAEDATSISSSALAAPPTDDGEATNALHTTTLRTNPRQRGALPQPSPAPPGPGSSDPPTAFVHRYDDHIDLPPGSIVQDAYEIDLKLGAGTMGEVYAARHLQLGRRVAIKVIAPRLSQDPGAVERFSREAQALARIHHPGIVAIDHIGELPDGRAFFVMEHLTGEPLDARLARGPIPFDEALDILEQMARALEAAHRHGVVHRDLKPANTFLVRIPDEPRPIVKLLDFGLAKLAFPNDSNSGTQAGVALGTPMYLSPEQALGPNVDARTDIYALGCLAYELILGRLPFPATTSTIALLASHLHESPPRPSSIWPGIPLTLDLVLFALLAKSPPSRPTLAQFRSVLADLKTPIVSSHDHRRASTFVSSPPAPSRAILVTLVVLAMLCGAAITVALGHR